MITPYFNQGTRKANPLSIGDFMKVRACIRCKQYVVIKEGYKNQLAIKIFEKDHTGHNLGTLDYNDVKDKGSGFESKTNEYTAKA